MITILLTNFFRKLVECADDVRLVVVVDVAYAEHSKENDKARSSDRDRVVSV